MSSTNPRAFDSSSSWQQPSNSKSTTRNPTAQRPSQSPPIGYKAQNSQTVTSYPVQEAESHITHNSTGGPDESKSHTSSLQVEGRESSISTDFAPAHLIHGNYLTPDYGSEHPFTDQSSYSSPGFEDLLWQGNFDPSQNLDDFGSDGVLVNQYFPTPDQNVDLQGIALKEIPAPIIDPRSLTPRMSTTTTTTTTVNSQQNTTLGSSSSRQKTMGDNGKRMRPLDDENEEQDGRFSRSISNQIHSSAAVGHSMRDVVNPTVLISTYNRGDSPARSTLPMGRSLSKRSQGSRLSDHGESAASQDLQATETRHSISSLMPPDQFGDDDWDEEEEDTDRSGVAPTQRNEETIPSINDMDKQRELNESNVSVQNWLATSEAGSSTREAERVFRNRVRKDRMRSRSTGARTDQSFSDRHVPGPGKLIDVESENEYSDDESSQASNEGLAEIVPESPATDVKPVDPAKDSSYFPTMPEETVAPDEQEPLPRRFYRKALWQDPAKFPEISASHDQPPTSNHAIAQYDQAAAKFETASRAATWGTRRRMSDSEIASIVDGTKMRGMSLSSKVRDRGNSIVNRARTVIRRSSSNVKKSKEHLPREHFSRESLSRQQSPSNDIERTSSIFETDQGHAATSPIQQMQRTFSWGKVKSPPLSSTSGALLAMTGQLTAVGGSTVASVEPPERPIERSKSPFSKLKRSRSHGKTEQPKNPGLSELFNRHGGPPVPTLASPFHRNELSEPSSPKLANNVSNLDDDMDEDNGDEVPIKMELTVQDHNIIPNLEGFKAHARQLNPRLDLYLVERIAQDQLRRYKKLVKNKIEHKRNVQLKQQCQSGTFCTDLGGRPKILPPRTSAKDSNVNFAQFKIGNGGDSDPEDGSFVEGGIVTPALFPSGIPLPPANHLPAEFECPLCFQVKKFQKPSDWTKHVHEDVQPFSCTFPNCPEPKSFKRKADWVRHENERHRHLEWWKCSIPECAHICYRKDNFVQHLVREHKMIEPKSKGARSTNRTRPAARSPQGLGNDTDGFWQLVERCRHDTSLTPKQEPCKFCGNICSSWKKLSVHVGKHMEQIAMPVLGLAAKKSITVDTVISPIDPPAQRLGQTSMLDATTINGANYEALSPYTASAVSNYQSSSAGQSPVPMQSVHSQGSHPGQAFYDNGMMQPMTTSMQHFTDGTNVSQNYPYPSYEVADGQNQMHMPYQGNMYTIQPVTQGIPAHFDEHQVPRSQPMDNGYATLNVDTAHAAMYSNDGYYPHSAPGGTYTGGFNQGLGNPNGLHSPHARQAGHSHSPVAGVPPNGSGFMFTPQQNGAHAPSYY